MLALASCNEGIAPLEEGIDPGFSGTITFMGEWPTDIYDTYIVLFKNALEEASDFSIINLQYVSESIPSGTTLYEYNTLLNVTLGEVEAGTYEYLAVAQLKTPELSLNRSDWVVVGVYFTGGDFVNPATLVVPQNSFLENINITCDFNNPPPQPPKSLK